MAFETRVTLKGSERTLPAGAHSLGPVADNQEIRVTLILRRKTSPPDFPVAGAAVSRAGFLESFIARESDLTTIDAFAQAYGLKIIESNAIKRRVVMTGSAAAAGEAFGTRLNTCIVPGTGQRFRVRTGPLSIPSELESVVEAVLGLDTRPVVESSAVPNQAFSSTAYTPMEVAQLYKFPSDVRGAGQTIALLEFGGGFSFPDLEGYFGSLGIRMPNVTAVSVNGGRNSPGSRIDVEVMLDIEVAGAIANAANIAVYFAPNTDEGFTNAILDAVHDSQRRPSVISISWGATEETWTPQALTAVNSALQDAALLGVSVVVAAGDGGSSDGQGDARLHVDFPAASPFSLGCGGTTLLGSGTNIVSEAVWNDAQGATGGGVSNFFALPAYQVSAGVPTQPQTSSYGRGVPDVAGNADPSTGYRVRVHGVDLIVGGTSAVAPLWAALIALFNEKLGSRLGYMNKYLYLVRPAGFRDIVNGNNDDSHLGFYTAGSGWNACTGLGTPNGTALLSALQKVVKEGPGSPEPPVEIPPPPPSRGGYPSIWDF
jgi:kumamolisin